jgi:transcriptional regulator with XRE-family HTH domain
VSNSRDLPRDIGEFIRDLRSNARISLRQLAEQAGVSNPYLSQIERGLRKPSAEVLAQLASALRVSTPMMYLRAGLLDSKDGQGVLAAVAADPDLTLAQKQSLTQIYETFRRENARESAETPAEPVTTTTGRPRTARKKAAAPVANDEPAATPAARPPGRSTRTPAAARRTGSGRTRKDNLQSNGAVGDAGDQRTTENQEESS